MIDEGIERLISGWLDHNLAAQAVAVVEDDLLLCTRLHGISLLQDLRDGSLHHRCIRLQPRRIDVHTGNSKHQGLQHDSRSFVMGWLISAAQATKSPLSLCSIDPSSELSADLLPTTVSEPVANLGLPAGCRA